MLFPLTIQTALLIQMANLKHDASYFIKNQPIWTVLIFYLDISLRFFLYTKQNLD